MKILVVMAALLLSCGMSLCAGQSANSGSQNTADAAKPVAQSSSNSADTTTDQAKTKPKRVWTNEEIAGVGGDGAISVVGKAGGGIRIRHQTTSRKLRPARPQGTSKPLLTAIAFIN
jgi:hypothetical protein